jgi:hypothetical protein
MLTSYHPAERGRDQVKLIAVAKPQPNHVDDAIGASIAQKKADLTAGEKKEFASLLKELVARWRRK